MDGWMDGYVSGWMGEWMGVRMSRWMDVRADRGVGQCQIWTGPPPGGSMLICNGFVCDQHLAGFGLTVCCLR